MTTNEKTYSFPYSYTYTIQSNGEDAVHTTGTGHMTVKQLEELREKIESQLKEIAFSKTLAGKLARDLAAVHDAENWDDLPNISKRGFFKRAAMLIDDKGWTNPVLQAESVRRHLDEIAEEAEKEPRAGYAPGGIVSGSPRPEYAGITLGDAAALEMKDRMARKIAAHNHNPVPSRPTDQERSIAGYLVDHGWTDQAGHGRRLNDEEIEAIRILHDAAHHATVGDAISPTKREAVKKAIVTLERFRP